MQYGQVVATGAMQHFQHAHEREGNEILVQLSKNLW
jgi:hypothetical protein